jgi:hypothetical protein
MADKKLGVPNVSVEDDVSVTIHGETLTYQQRINEVYDIFRSSTGRIIRPDLWWPGGYRCTYQGSHNRRRY